jgi:glycosyltransferase involved in cell wall biosynthesis
VSSQRIAILSTSYPTGAGDASGHFVESEARQLAALGHRVTVIAAGRPSGPAASSAGIEVVWIFDAGVSGWPGISARLRREPWRALGLGFWSLGARAALQRRGPFDRVIAHWLLPAGYPVLTHAEVGHAELEIVVHGSDARLVERWPAPIRKRLFAQLSRKGVRLRCVSGQLSDVIRRAAGDAYPQPIRVLPAALEIGTVKTKQAARAELGIAPQQRIVVIAARLVPDKRVDCALRAAALVPGLEALVIGDGEEADSLRRTFPEVRFLGRLPRPETLTYLAAADAVLSASRTEGAPCVVREARALGVPVVACSAGDIADWASSDPGLWVVA